MSPPPFDQMRVHLESQNCLYENIGDEDFLRLAEKWVIKPCSAILLSGGEVRESGENRYSIAVCDPLLVLKGKEDNCLISVLDEDFKLKGNPLDIMDQAMNCLKHDFPLSIPPFTGGAVGYFAYDLKNSIEQLPQRAKDDLQLPDLFLFWPKHILVHDRLNGRVDFLKLALESETRETDPPLTVNDDHFLDLSLQASGLQSNFTHEAYLKAVSQVRRYIRDGDVYQVNLSQRYRFSFKGDCFDLWRSLFQMNPAPFYAFVNAGDHQVLSTSMERFLFRRGRYIETRPIKGTRKRGCDQKEDRELMQDLFQSQKDEAELSMIVDLLRNDLGRICAPRTVTVAAHKRLESYQNVHHLVSIITGELREKITPGDILRATFPGGSITGCPKIRAMEIIDELVKDHRSIQDLRPLCPFRYRRKHPQFWS